MKAEVAELLARAEAADQAEVIDGMSIPDELARAKERFEQEMAEHRAAGRGTAAQGPDQPDRRGLADHAGRGRRV